MKRQLYERRQKMVKYIAQGIQMRAVMTQLSEDYNVAENTLWQDWYRRDKWLPLMLQLDQEDAKKWFGDLFAMIMEARNAFWSIYQKTDNPFAKIQAVEKAVKIAETQLKLLSVLFYNYSSTTQTSQFVLNVERIDVEVKNFLGNLYNLEYMQNQQ